MTLRISKGSPLARKVEGMAKRAAPAVKAPHLTPYSKPVRGKGKGSGQKFGNVKCTIDGIEFDSLREGRRYGQLKLMQQAGRIRNLALQVTYPITAHGVLICKYIADFDYEEPVTVDGMAAFNTTEATVWVLVTEDAKGHQTDVFRLKSKLFTANYGRSIRLS